MPSDTQTAHFDLGTRTSTGPTSTYYGSGWHKPDGTVVLCPYPDLVLIVNPDGGLSVRHNREVAW